MIPGYFVGFRGYVGQLTLLPFHVLFVEEH
jgi:hypothetical protein